MPRSYQKKRLANESSERLSLFSPAAILIGFAGRKDEFWISHRSSSLVFYSLLADLVLISHLMFILFILAGGLLALRWKRAACFHLPAAAWGVLIELADRICPLTPLENRLRLKAGELGYERGFIEHYLLPKPAASARRAGRRRQRNRLRLRACAAEAKLAAKLSSALTTGWTGPRRGRRLTE